MRRDRAQIARDIALARLTRVNRWVTAGAFVAVGALTDVVAHAAPGHAIAKPAASPGPPTRESPTQARRIRHPHPHPAPKHHHHVDRPLQSTKPPAPAAPQPTQAAPAPAPAAPQPTQAATAPASAPVSGGS
jgi:hypothetical protein